MTERDATRDGLSFTGHYSHDKEGVKANAKIIRDAGLRAIVVNVPTNKLSRGSHAMGYSVYAEPAYFQAVEKRRKWEEAKRNIESGAYVARIDELKAQLDKASADYVTAAVLLAGLEPLNVR
jgi:hypothetical protein